MTIDVYWTDRHNIPRAYACGEDDEERAVRAEALAQVMSQDGRKFRAMREHIIRTEGTLDDKDEPRKFASTPDATGLLQRIEEASMQPSRKPRLAIESTPGPNMLDPRGGLPDNAFRELSERDPEGPEN